MSSRRLPDDSPAKQREPIAYAPAPSVVSVRGFRLLVFLTLVNTALLGGYVLGPQFFGFAKSQWSAYQQRQAERQREAAERARRPAMIAAEERAMAYKAEPGKILYDDDPALRPTAGERGTRASPWPMVVPRPQEAAALPSGLLWESDPVLFMHERRASANSAARLVVVTFRNVAPLELRAFVTGTIRPTTLDKTGGTELEGSHHVRLPRGRSLRLYAGEPDTEDASRFVIPYELGDERGLIHGQLQGNGVVRLWATGPLEQPLQSAMQAWGP